MEISFHYPPELLQLLIDTLPKLCKSKSDLLLFFRGAGVSHSDLTPYQELLKTNKAAFNKYHVASELLTKVNEQGERSLRTRRELLKRVVEFDDFSICWENDRAAARGLVAQIRELINVKDSFTRMRNERDEEKRQRVEQQQAAVTERIAQKSRRDRVKNDLYRLFGEADAHKRGRSLEGVLNELFACQDILVRQSFSIRGSCSEGVIEQIDGLIELAGHSYLVEMKWWNGPLGIGDVAPHLVRVFGRGGQARGLFLSYTPFTAPAVAECRNALAGGAVIVLATLQEIVDLLERDGDLQLWLKRKVDAAIIDKNPLFTGS